MFTDFLIPPTEQPPTLAAALRERLEGKSWSQVRQLVHGRRIEVNETLCVDDARRLKEGDVIRVWEEARPKLPDENAVRIVHCDDDVVVVEKPAGVATVRHRAEQAWAESRKSHQPTLEELVQRILTQSHQGKKKKPSHAPRLRIVHRIDRDTSGLVVFARTVTAERHLAAQFKAHTVIRRYLAIAEGRVKAAKIESQLVRDRGDGIRGSHPTTGQHAVTHVAPLEQLADYCLVECRLETGRTHQIRIHLAEQGNRLCGEKVYRRQINRPPEPDRSGAKRQALHAAELGFLHPRNDQQIRFESPLPSDMQMLWERLKRRNGS